VPDTLLRWFKQQAKKIVNLEGEDYTKLFQQSDLQKLGGMNFWQSDRLFDEGIESIQDLAMKDIPSLLISTRFDTSHTLYWVDQALLSNQVGNHMHLFENAFIKTASDLLAIKNELCLENIYKPINGIKNEPHASSEENNSSFEQTNEIITREMVENILIAIKNGPNLPTKFTLHPKILGQYADSRKKKTKIGSTSPGVKLGKK
jgi:hypothetical protein